MSQFEGGGGGFFGGSIWERVSFFGWVNLGKEWVFYVRLWD